MKKKDHPILAGKTPETIAKLTGKSISAKPMQMEKPKPTGKKVDTGKMVARTIEAGKEMKAAKRASRKETAAMALGGLAATAGTVLTGIKNRRNQIKKGF